MWGRGATRAAVKRVVNEDVTVYTKDLPTLWTRVSLETNEIIKVQFGLRQGKDHDNSEVTKVSK